MIAIFSTTEDTEATEEFEHGIARKRRKKKGNRNLILLIYLILLILWEEVSLATEATEEFEHGISRKKRKKKGNRNLILLIFFDFTDPLGDNLRFFICENLRETKFCPRINTNFHELSQEKSV